LCFDPDYVIFNSIIFVAVVVVVVVADPYLDRWLADLADWLDHSRFNLQDTAPFNQCIESKLVDDPRLLTIISEGATHFAVFRPIAGDAAGFLRVKAVRRLDEVGIEVVTQRAVPGSAEAVLGQEQRPRHARIAYVLEAPDPIGPPPLGDGGAQPDPSLAPESRIAASFRDLRDKFAQFIAQKEGALVKYTRGTLQEVGRDFRDSLTQASSARPQETESLLLRLTPSKLATLFPDVFDVENDGKGGATVSLRA